jgi:hypothetical protein
MVSSRLGSISGGICGIAGVPESLAQAKRRQFATDSGVEAAFRRFDP